MTRGPRSLIVCITHLNGIKYSDALYTELIQSPLLDEPEQSFSLVASQFNDEPHGTRLDAEDPDPLHPEQALDGGQDASSLVGPKRVEGVIDFQFDLGFRLSVASRRGRVCTPLRRA